MSLAVRMIRMPFQSFFARRTCSWSDPSVLQVMEPMLMPVARLTFAKSGWPIFLPGE